MATAVGYEGNVVMPSGHNFKPDMWQGSFGMALIDTTGFEDGGFRTAQGGLRSGAGSATGHVKYNAASTTPGTIAASRAGASATLTITTGCTVTGTMLVANVGHSVDVNGESRVSFDWAFTATITHTHDETP
jgi:hypothetical protein